MPTINQFPINTVQIPDLPAPITQTPADALIVRQSDGQDHAVPLGQLTVPNAYLGAFASDPTQTPLGQPIAVGMIYLNTTANPNKLRVYTATGWADYDASAQAAAAAAAGSASSAAGFATAAQTAAGIASAVATFQTNRPSVRLATNGALPANTYNNGAGTITMNATGVLTIDGKAVALGDDIVVKDEAAQADNGVYHTTTAGAVGVAAVLTRRGTENNAAGLGNACVQVQDGTVNVGWTYLCQQASGSITLGTTPITFAGEATAIAAEATRAQGVENGILATVLPDWPVSPQGIKVQEIDGLNQIRRGMTPTGPFYPGLSDVVAALSSQVAAAVAQITPLEPVSPFGIKAILYDGLNQIRLGMGPNNTLFPPQGSAGYESILPNDPRLLTSDYCTINEQSAVRLRYQRTITDANNHQYTSPGSRLGFETNAANVTFEVNFTGLSSGASNALAGVLVDGAVNTTFSSNAVSINLDGNPHKVELVWPYGASMDLDEIRLTAGAGISSPPARPSNVLACCGDSITQGFFASDVFHSWEYLLAGTQGMQLVSMGNASRTCVPSDGTALGALTTITKATYLIGVNDWTGNVTISTFTANYTSFYNNFRAAKPTAPLYLITPIHNQNETNPNGNGDTLAAFRTAITNFFNAHSGADTNLHLIDGTTLMPNNPSYFQDSTHPNDLGHATIATNLQTDI